MRLEAQCVREQPCEGFLFFFFLIIYFWLRRVFVTASRLSLVAASRGYSSLQWNGFSLRWLHLMQSTGVWVSVVVTHRL